MSHGRLGHWWPGVVLALAGRALVGCQGAAEATDLPNLVVVTLDTTRADHLGSYGYFRDTSPALDELAKASIVFERAIAPMATTLPTHVSLFTAATPLEHGVLANTTQGGERFVPSRGLRSFAEVVRGAGYGTAAFVSAAPLKRGSGIEDGFDVFDEPEGKKRRGDLTTDRALRWLGGARQPFLLWVHYYDAHWPYEAPPPFGERYRTDAELDAWLGERRIPDSSYRPLVRQHENTRASWNAYDGELRFQDEQLGRLVGALRGRPDWDDTAVVVVGDHGEGLSQHGHPAHGGTWNEQLHVPLLIRAPGARPRRVGALVSVHDALPTLLGLIATPELEAFLEQATGRDALRLDFSEVPVLSQDTGRSSRESLHRYSLTGPRYKYFRSDGGAKEKLYDLSADPFELHDVSEREADVVASLRRAMLDGIDAQRRRGAALRGSGEVETLPTDPEILEQLRALGYLEPEASEPEASPPEPSGSPGSGGSPR